MSYIIFFFLMIIFASFGFFNYLYSCQAAQKLIELCEKE